jgi:hypothetical protein
LDNHDGTQVIEFSGHYPLMLHGCAVIDDVKVLREDADVIVVLPVMHVYEDREGCELTFKKSITLEEPFRGEGLLHVRSVNGNSFNAFISQE